jgi:hypothetical protein
LSRGIVKFFAKKREKEPAARTVGGKMKAQFTMRRNIPFPLAKLL